MAAFLVQLHLCCVLRILEVVRRLGTLDCNVDGADSVGELSGEGPGLKCVESLVELLYLGNPKDHPITMLSIQDAMKRRPSQRSCVPANTMFLGSISKSGHRGLNGRLTIKFIVQFPDDVLISCQNDLDVTASGTYIIAPPSRDISIA